MLTKEWFIRRLREFRVEHDDCRQDVCSIQDDLDEIVNRYADIIAQAVKDMEREKAERLVVWLEEQKRGYPMLHDPWTNGYLIGLGMALGRVRDEFLARFDRNGRPL